MMLDPLEKIYEGKVRDVYQLDDDELMIHTTDRLTAFDRYITDIPGKGRSLTEVSAFWFKKTEHIIPNHYISHQDSCMIVRKATPIRLEIIVRGYLTGSTKTSIYRHYADGKRVYAGHRLPDGLERNQQLEKPIVTPTTKGDIDEVISGKEVIEQNILTEEEFGYLEKKALELYEIGSRHALEKGLILVDTKYEFGRDSDRRIILIDEIHTCDCSRYWFEDSYIYCFKHRIEPVKYDKDLIRDWINDRCDPYTEELPVVPDRVIKRVAGVYRDLANRITDGNLKE